MKQRGTLHVLYDVWEAGADEHLANRLNQPRPLLGVPVTLGEIRIRLARRRRVDSIEQRYELWIELERVRLNERQRIVGLRHDANADNVKASLGVADTGAAGAAEKVE